MKALDLLERAETRRQEAVGDLDASKQSEFGQFFTPEQAASLIAGLVQLPRGGTFRVLDPGAGSGILSAALVSRVLMERPELALEIVAVEIDERLGSHLAATLDECEEEASLAGCQLTTRIVQADLLAMATGLALEVPPLAEPFDVVIMNPPYGKLAASSWQRRSLSMLGVQCPNLYAAFLAIGTTMLRPGGQLVAITPRSFANGPYFGQFRRWLLDRVALSHIHVFASRSTVFSDAGVLQENVVFAATRGATPSEVTLSTSNGHRDTRSERVVQYCDVVEPGDPLGFIRIATNDVDTSIAKVLGDLPCSLADLDLSVSTGRVVDFRVRAHLLEGPQNNSVPLIYPANLVAGSVSWPRLGKKPQAIARAKETEQLFLPNEHYVIVKRFSSKEERRRVVAAVHEPLTFDATEVAFENHLNVFHMRNRGMAPGLAWGLTCWLNSALVDRFFRTFSGHTQVNATDLRSLRYPSLSLLLRLGSEVESARVVDQDDIDDLVDRVILSTTTTQSA